MALGTTGHRSEAMRLSFLGAAGTVTGSRYLLDGTGGHRLLVDCGLFQGLKQLRLRNRAPFPVPPASIDAVVLTHAHIDHIGYLPVLVREGFSGAVYATPATVDLASIMLNDAARLQEEEAAYANAHGYARHRPALPLFTHEDVDRALRQLRPHPFEVELPLFGGVTATFVRNAHIPGSASVAVQAENSRIVFSGDLGRPNDLLTRAGTHPGPADYVVMESTYGGRRHTEEDPVESLAQIVARTAARGGAVIIPAFAVGRAQTVLIQLARLLRSGRIPAIPIFLDSPLASSVSDVIQRHAGELRVDVAEWRSAMAGVDVSDSVEESKAIDRQHGPFIVVAGSGMATGGRVIHHLKAFAPDHRSTVLFVGFQAQGTRGHAMLAGARVVRIHGKDVPVRAEVRVLDGFSAHADEDGLLAWLREFGSPPVRTFLTHGEPLAADNMRRAIQDRMNWSCEVPEHLGVAQLAPIAATDGAHAIATQADAGAG